jgi:metallo-beta-lactamase family protein
MSGDLGRLDHDTAFIRHPDSGYPKDIDYVLMESTRGGQRHPPPEDSRLAWEDIIRQAYANKSRVICGAFSIMRTQLILDDLYRLYQQGKLPADFPVFLDSPSAAEVNGIIRGHPECYDARAAQELARPGDNPFDFPNLHHVQDREGSKRINRMDGPLLVVASSGMWEHGRVIHHLEQSLDDPNAILVQTGYQAKGTLGRRLQEGPQEHSRIRIYNRFYRYKAELKAIHGYSGHADIDDITKHLQGTNAKGIFLVHGEAQASADAAKALASRGHPNVIVPDRYKGYVLDGQALQKHLWTP